MTDILTRARDKRAARDRDIDLAARRLRIRTSAVRRRREDALTGAIYKRAAAIHNGAPQDPGILCPVRSGGYWCQWVAGHYGGCVLGRPWQQRSVKGLR